jgi:hypothetical protein
MKGFSNAVWNMLYALGRELRAHLDRRFGLRAPAEWDLGTRFGDHIIESTPIRRKGKWL